MRATEDFPAVVLGYVAAGRLGIDRVPAGDAKPSIFVGDRWFTVIGVLGPTPLAPDIDRSVLVGWEAARKELRFDGHPTVVYVKAREESIEDVRAVLPATLYSEIPGLVQVSRPSDALAAKRATQNSYAALFLGPGRRRPAGRRGRGGEHDGHLRAGTPQGDRPAPGAGRHSGPDPRPVPDRGRAAVQPGRARRDGARRARRTSATPTLQGWPVVIPPAAMAGGVFAAVVVGIVAGLYPSVRAARLTPTQALSAT